ncbi:hypothetical protein EMIT0111MI5_250040 [Burkholderia sp. IT-111MI5]
MRPQPAPSSSRSSSSSISPCRTRRGRCGVPRRPGVTCMIGSARRQPFPDGCRPANRGLAHPGRADSAYRRHGLGLTPKPPECYRTRSAATTRRRRIERCARFDRTGLCPPARLGIRDRHRRPVQNL